MRLDNLTIEQADMCDVIWSIPDKDKFNAVSKTWPLEKKQMALTLIQMMVQEELELEIEKMNSFPIAEKLIESVMR